MRSSFLFLWQILCIQIQTDRQTDRSITHKPRKAYQYIALTAYHILYTVTQMGSVGQSKKKKNSTNQISLYANNQSTFEKLQCLHSQGVWAVYNILQNKAKTSRYLHNNSALKHVPEHSFLIQVPGEKKALLQSLIFRQAGMGAVSGRIPLPDFVENNSHTTTTT